jgi:hypothetical protein
MKLIHRNDVRRKKVHDIAERPEKHATVNEETIKARTQFRKIASVLGKQFDGRDRADLAEIADGGVTAEQSKALSVHARYGGDALEDGLVLKDLQAGACGGAAERICGERMTVEESVAALGAAEGGFNAIRADGESEGQKAASEPFGKAQQVGNDAGLLASEHRTGAAEAGEHLVRDEENTVAGAKLADPMEEFHGMDNHAASALQKRFDDDGSDAIAALGKDLLQAIGAFDVTCFALQA